MLVLISGAEQATQPVRAALERSGSTVLQADADPGEKADAYVQLPTLLPVDGPSPGDSLVDRVGRFLSDGLLTRFRSAAAVLPLLRGRHCRARRREHPCAGHRRRRPGRAGLPTTVLRPTP